MLLSTKIKLTNGAVLCYEYNSLLDRHSVSYRHGCAEGFWMKFVKKPGEIINLIAPYRDGNPEVCELIAWLSERAELPRYA
ncbi:hypothetical protein SEA_DIRKDIRK_77 [Mycobacterium phage DirkDirk]|uniref:Uncharacterized protein n=1 Tax=Mycobacterium phage DirkDirk TaxID=2664225 RepID=A0A5Q2WFA4_9CAUD|nr:hypothetical protein KNU85_gp077 [Mycobacterium phage DirkDirk]QGH75187.1 hypothetical protein SEA_DIRKDIRK_77 [Mycobacterium phage DirkDirk]